MNDTEFRDAVLTSLGRIEATTSGLREDVDRHESVLNGNGRPGLASRVAILEDRGARYGGVAGGITAGLVSVVAIVLQKMGLA